MIVLSVPVPVEFSSAAHLAVFDKQQSQCVAIVQSTLVSSVDELTHSKVCVLAVITMCTFTRLSSSHLDKSCINNAWL